MTDDDILYENNFFQIKNSSNSNNNEKRLKGLKRIQSIATRKTPFIFAYQLEEDFFSYYNFERLNKENKFDYKALFGKIGLNEHKPIFEGEEFIKYEKTGEKIGYYWHEVLPNDNSISDCRLIFDMDVDKKEKMKYFIDNLDKILEAFEMIITKTFNHFTFDNIKKKSKEEVIKELLFNWLKSDNPDKVGYHLVILNVLICGDRPAFFEIFYEIMVHYAKRYTIFDFLRDENDELDETLIDRHLQVKNHMIRLVDMFKRSKKYEYKPLKNYTFGDCIATVAMENKRDKEKGNYVMINDDDELTKEIKLKLERKKKKYVTEFIKDNIPENYIELLEKHIPNFNEMWKIHKIYNNVITCKNINTKHKCGFENMYGVKCDRVHTGQCLEVCFRNNIMRLRNYACNIYKYIEWREKTDEDNIKKYTKKEIKDYYKEQEDIKAEIGINEIKPLIFNVSQYGDWNIIDVKRIYDNETKMNILDCDEDQVILSPMDSGKTYALFMDIKAKKYNRVLIYCKLRKQGRMLVKSAQEFGLNFKFYEDLNIDEIINCDYLVCSLESVNKLKKGWGYFDLIVMDESEGLLDGFGNKITHGDNIAKNVDTFEWLISICGKVICMDAYASNMTLDFLRDLDRQCRVTINKYRPTKPDVYLVKEKNAKGKDDFKLSYEKIINMFQNMFIFLNEFL